MTGRRALKIKRGGDDEDFDSVVEALGRIAEDGEPLVTESESDDLGLCLVVESIHRIVHSRLDTHMPDRCEIKLHGYNTSMSV